MFIASKYVTKTAKKHHVSMYTTAYTIIAQHFCFSRHSCWELLSIML